MIPTQHGQISVLCVDDDPDFAELTAHFLERENDRLETLTATDPDDAFAALHEQEIDCVISDYDMPGQDGVGFLRTVREEYPNLPFILYTGRGSEEIASKAISAGVTDYLQKGHGTDQYLILANRITNAVERYRADVERQRHLNAIETAQEGISLLDEDGRYTYVNETYADLYGYEPDEMLGEHWELVYRDADAREIHEEVLPLVENEGSWRGETTGLRADGSTFYEDHTLSKTADGELVCTVRDITDRKEYERQFETLIENLPGIVYRCRNEQGWPMEEIRGDVKNLTGYPAADLKSGNVSLGEDIIHPDDQESVWEAVQDATDSDSSFELTYRIVIRDGDTRWVWEHGQVTHSADSDTTTLEGFITDITERKERKRELQRERALIEQALDTLDELFYVVGTDGELRRWNRRLTEVTGYADEEIARMHATDFFVESDQAKVADAVEETLTTGKTVVEAEILTNNGDRLPYEFTGVRLVDDDENPMGLVGIGRAIRHSGLGETINR